MAKPDTEPLTVTDENFGALLIQGLKEALAFERGERGLVRRLPVGGPSESLPTKPPDGALSGASGKSRPLAATAQPRPCGAPGGAGGGPR